MSDQNEDILSLLEKISVKQDDFQKEIRSDIDDLKKEVKEKTDSASRMAKAAWDQSVEATRISSETEKSQSDTVKAMMQHAKSVEKSAQIIVTSNSAQTPLIERTDEIATYLKRQTPKLVAIATAVGGIMGAALHAYAI